MSAPIAGAWTPWADVLCRNCHDQLGQEVTAKREIKWPAGEKREGDGLGFCTHCGAQVWVHEDIAQLTRLWKLAGGVLEQTGGMCAALTIGRLDGGTVVVANMDGPITLGIYAQGEWEEGQEAREVYSLPAATPDDVAATIILTVLRTPMQGEK